MAFGNVDDDRGQWQQKPPSKTDVEPKEPAAQADPPPAAASPPAKSHDEIDVDYVAAIATANLPDEAAFTEFASWSIEQLPTLTQQVIQTSAVNQPRLVQDMNDWLKTIIDANEELNKKQPAPTQPVPQATWPPLPGVSVDDLCTSVFDANDLALRGRKSVLAKMFHVPLIFPQLLLGPAQQWAFGQKIDYRQEWRHEGFTLGELISSLSLLPNEELTLEVSSWQRTKTEIAEETNTERRERMEREQRRTDEETCVNEAASSNGWTVAASGSISYGPASASASATQTGNTAQRAEQVARQVAEATSRAANEISLKRAVKMTQTAEAGSESRTTRRIKNPNTCHSVTFNFFQIVKLYDVQLRLDNDAPTLLLPAIFPAFYDDGKPVLIPYWAIEAFNSPAVFLTQFFEVDRDLSQEIHGFGLRVRMDVGRNPSTALTQLVEALIVATKFLLKLDPAAHIRALAAFVANYAANAMDLRTGSAARYGVGKGQSEQVTTPGIYADSLLGRCSACESVVEASRYVEVMRQFQDQKQLERSNELAETEVERRKKLLEEGTFDPFEPLPR